MSARFALIFFAALTLAIAALPSLSLADSGYSSIFANIVSNGTVLSGQQANGCVITFKISDEGLIHMSVQSPSFTIQEVGITPGSSYYYPDPGNPLRIYVANLNETAKTAFVDISKPVATATASPTGTKIYCDTPGQMALAGDTVTFPIVIQNYDADHTYTLSASNDAGWTTGFQYNAGKNIFQIFVPQSQSRTVNLVVDTAYVSTVGKHDITVRADGYSITLSVMITSVNNSAQLSAQVESVIASLGSNIYYDIGLQNLQAQSNDYKLSVTGLPENWYYRYVSARGSTDEMAEAVVPADSTKNIVLQIVPPLSAQVGDYNFTATMTTPDGIVISKALTLRLKGAVSMAVSTDQLSYSTGPGQAFNVKVYVTNNGQGGSLTNVYPDVQAPSGWTVNVTPAMVNSIKPDETQVFTVNVQPPANIVANVYALNMAVKSDQSTSATTNYQITITTSSIVPYIGGAVVLMVIGGLVVMYRKYGRR